MKFDQHYDVIVVGGGHAGTEAALASARTGASTLLLTHNIETIGQMSCNPAIGGIGKSHLVKEIDALDGAMAKATDKGGIQFRVLNQRKGPAVRATRAQADRQLYKAAIRDIVENQPNLSLFQQGVDDLIIEGDKVIGVITQMGLSFYSTCVVLTTGTFLGGQIHIGLQNYQGGRAGDPPANKLSQRLRALPFRVERLKTGTPPRIDAKSVDFSVMEAQPGDTPRPVMSYMGSRDQHPEQVNCYITYTNEKTHDIIRGGLDRSPMFSGIIEGIGPRYCPSIEDKIHRFADKDRHQIFIEPEGLTTSELYPNGISTSLPFDVQMNLVRSIAGMENAHILRPGYAIEYDYLNPQDLQHTLETKIIENLFFAGQINGTTGYEEAGAQGLVAGANAALKAASKSLWKPTRDTSYIGVLIDDLVTLGTKEPYRMFTSRAEFRLLLRQDNADLRLTAIGRELGLVGNERWSAFSDKKSAIEAELAQLKELWIQAGSEQAAKLAMNNQVKLSHEYNLHDLLKRPNLTLADLKAVMDLEAVSEQVSEQVEIQVKYAGYIDRQAEEVQRLQQNESVIIPDDFDYHQIKGLSNEILDKLLSVKPTTLGQASRISGVTPAAVSQILIFLKRHKSAQDKLA